MASLDFYATPSWCVDLLMSESPPPSDATIVEPSAGDGAILRALSDYRSGMLACEVDPAHARMLEPFNAVIGDWLVEAPRICSGLHRFAIVSNPPYSEADKHVLAGLAQRPVYAAYLLKLNFLGAAKRDMIFSTWPLSELIVLKRRPSFEGRGRTDFHGYAWFIWRSGHDSDSVRFSRADIGCHPYQWPKQREAHVQRFRQQVA